MSLHHVHFAKEKLRVFLICFKMRTLHSIVSRDTEMVQSCYCSSTANRENSLFGMVSNDPQTILINHILLLYKYFLYCKHNERGKVSFNAFKFYIKYIVKIEESMAKRKNNLKAHFSNWDPLKGLISIKKEKEARGFRNSSSHKQKVCSEGGGGGGG